MGCVFFIVNVVWKDFFVLYNFKVTVMYCGDLCRIWVQAGVSYCLFIVLLEFCMWKSFVIFLCCFYVVVDDI